MPARRAHDINLRVREYERRQFLLLASARPPQPQPRHDRSRKLRDGLARVLQGLAARVAPSTPIWSRPRQPRNAA